MLTKNAAIRILSSVAVTVTLAFFLCSTGNAQDVTNATNTGYPENAIIHGTEIESVQITNGNLHVQIPIWSARGRGLNTSGLVVYDNKEWFLSEHCYSSGICVDTVSAEPNSNLVLTARASTDYGISYKGISQNCSGGTQYSYFMSNVVIKEPDGTKHHFAPDPVGYSGENPCGNAVASTLYADDGSGWSMKLDSYAQPLYAVSKSGTIISSSSGNFEDSNGNQLNSTDTLGRTNGALTYFDSSGVQRSATISSTTSVTVATQMCTFSTADQCNEHNSTWAVPAVITLPNQMQYSFGYAQNQGAEITSISLPTGGQITYTYGAWQMGGRPVATRTVTADGTTGTWTYTVNGTGLNATVVTDPNLNDTSYDCSGWYTGDPCYTKNVYFYSGSYTTGTLLKTEITDYISIPLGYLPANYIQVPIRVTTTWSQTNQVKKTETDWDTATVSAGTTTWKNPLEVREYDFAPSTPGTLLRRTHYNYLHLQNPTYLNVNIADRQTSKIVYDASSNIVAQTTTTYDGSAVTSTSGVPNHDYTNFGSSNLVRGNPTTISRWLNPGNTWLNTVNAYDDLGNLVSTTDPLQHATQYSYNDSWANSSCVPSGVNTHAYLTQVTNALSQVTQIGYYPCTGLVASRKDQNDINAARSGTTYSYDLMARLTLKNLPDGGQASVSYNDIAPVSMTSTTKITSALTGTSTTVLDGLGRQKQTQLTSDPQGTVYTDTTYDSLGRTSTASNPYRSTSDPTYGLTTTQYDALSRVAKLIPPDGTTTVNNVTTSYSGNCTTVTDQASKSRKSCSDGLGRLTQVFEDPAALNYETDYTYDTLNNLLTVNQKGGSASSADWRTRTFTYDSLSRLLTASNPESGTTTYTYDNNGNLQTKVAPAPNQTGSTTVTTTYSYDLLNRLTWKHYSDGTMIAGFGYDGKDEGGNPLSGVTNAIGRLTHSSNEVNGASTYSYDPMGRAVLKRGCVPLNCVDTAFPVVVTYDMAGDVTSYTNGAGVTLTQTIDTATRLTQITSSLNDAQHPVTLYSVDSSIGYYPQGALRKAYLGNGLTKTNAFNNALELCRVNLNSSSAALGTCADGIPSGNVLDLTAGFNAGIANNGNVASWNAVGQQAFNRTFIYDSLNRLGSMTDSASNQSCKGLSWTYDAWGNRTDQTVTLGSCLTFHTTVTTQNRLYDPVNNIYQYDAAGNLTYDGSHSYTYDDENRLSKVDGGSTATYVYDVEGRRIEKSVAGVRTDFVYDPSGKIVAETNGSGWQLGYVYAGGTLIAQYSGSATYFAQTDHLGSTRLLTGLGQTLASNGGFEQGQTGWTGWSGSVTLVTDPTRAHSGSNYVQISEPVNGGGSVGSASYAVQQGDQITFGGWAYLESGTAGYPGWFLAAEDANHNSINWIEAGPVPTTSSGWTFQSATYTVPAGVAFVHIYGDVYLPSSPMVLRVDDGFIDDDRTSLTIVQNLDYLPFGELNSSDSGITTHKFTGKERDSESGLDNFGARYHSSAMGRFVSPDPKHISAHLSDPQSFDRYAYARNNPFLYVDPDGKDFQKAAQDLKTFAKSMYIKVSIGIGYEAKVKVGAVEAKVGAAAKATAETSQDAILKVSRSAEAGASAGPTNGPKAGENISVEQTVLTINKDRTVTGAEKPNVTVTDTIGGNTSVNSSSEQIGLGLETPLGPEPIVGGAEVGTTREGLNALKDAASEVKDSLINPGPPSPPKPPAPPCSGGSYKCN